MPSYQTNIFSAIFQGMYKCKFNQPHREKRPRKRSPQFEVTDCPSALNIVIKNFTKTGRKRTRYDTYY